MQFANETVEKLKAPSFFLSRSEREEQHENHVNVDDDPLPWILACKHTVSG